jgi:hypothetical protein
VLQLCARHRAHQLLLRKPLRHSEHFLVGDEAVQDGLNAHAKDLEEHAGHPEGENEAQKHRGDDASDVVVVNGIYDGKVAKQRGQRRDEDLQARREGNRDNKQKNVK